MAKSERRIRNGTQHRLYSIWYLKAKLKLQVPSSKSCGKNPDVQKWNICADDAIRCSAPRCSAAFCFRLVTPLHQLHRILLLLGANAAHTCKNGLHIFGMFCSWFGSVCNIY